MSNKSFQQQSSLTTMYHQIQVFKDTMQTSSFSRKSFLQLLFQTWSVKKLIKSILIGFVIVQISLILFSPPRVKQDSEKSIFTEELLLDKHSNLNLDKNIPFQEKRLGDRGIKSLRSADYDMAKKLQFEKKSVKKGLFLVNVYA